jgi:hypothetical protein
MNIHIYRVLENKHSIDDPSTTLSNAEEQSSWGDILFSTLLK